MQTVHKPVLVEEVIKYLQPKKNQNFIDCTIGGGGHAAKILEKIGSKGKLLGLDWDPCAINRCRVALKKYQKQLVLVNDCYVNLKQIVSEKKFGPVHGVLFDLGLSSDQLELSGRGFSFQTAEPLDMRFDPEENDLTAEEIVNQWPVEKIKKILFEYSEEKFAGKIARAIEAQRKEAKIKTTTELVAVILSAVPKQRSKIHPATKTFQALRIAVNNELNNIRLVLKDILDIVDLGGRVGVISFHSLEDRIVKNFFKYESVECVCPPEIPLCQCGHNPRVKIITKKPVSPSLDEVAANPRSRSAKLRVVERVK